MCATIWKCWGFWCTKHDLFSLGGLEIDWHKPAGEHWHLIARRSHLPSAKTNFRFWLGRFLFTRERQNLIETVQPKRKKEKVGYISIFFSHLSPVLFRVVMYCIVWCCLVLSCIVLYCVVLSCLVNSCLVTCLSCDLSCRVGRLPLSFSVTLSVSHLPPPLYVRGVWSAVVVVKCCSSSSEVP